MTDILSLAALFIGCNIGAFVYYRHIRPTRPNLTKLEREVTALSVTLSAVDDVVDDETARQITERANDRLADYDLDTPVEMTNASATEGD